MNRKTIAKLSAVVITIILVAILLSQIRIADIITTIAGIDPLYLLAGFVLYVCSYFFRALRFHILLNREVRLRDLFNIVCVHNMVNNILPARTGELSYIYLLKKLHNKTTGEGIATLFVARVFDFISISLLFFIAIMSIHDLPVIFNNIILIFAIIFLLIVLLLLVLVYFDEKIMIIFKNIAIKFGVKNNSIVDYLLRKGDEIIKNFCIIKSKPTVIMSSIASIGVWLSAFLMTQVLLSAINIQMDIMHIIIVSTLPTFSVILPIQGIGGFGTLEGAWAISLMSFGISKEMSILSGFSLHIISIVYFSILGGISILKLRFKGLQEI